MKTHLDYAVRCIVTLAAEYPRCGLAIAGARDDGEAFLQLASTLKDNAADPDVLARYEAVFPGVCEWVLFTSQTATIIQEPSPEACGMPSPLRIALSRETAGMLTGARTGPAIEAVFAETLAARRALYLDVAHGGLVVGGRLQVRAILAGVTPDTGEPRMTAVLTPPGSEHGRRVTWIKGERDPRRCLWSAEHGAFEPERALQGTGVEFAAVLQAAEDLLTLAVVHAATTPERGAALPYAPPGDPRRHGRKGRQVAKKWSLFRIECLAPPRDRQGRRMPRRGGGGGADLAVRQSVKGHFKLQRWGLKNRQRKLIFIASYPRGRGRYRGALTVPGPSVPAPPPRG